MHLKTHRLVSAPKPEAPNVRGDVVMKNINVTPGRACWVSTCGGCVARRVQASRAPPDLVPAVVRPNYVTQLRGGDVITSSLSLCAAASTGCGSNWQPVWRWSIRSVDPPPTGLCTPDTFSLQIMWMWLRFFNPSCRLSHGESRFVNKVNASQVLPPTGSDIYFVHLLVNAIESDDICTAPNHRLQVWPVCPQTLERGEKTLENPEEGTLRNLRRNHRGRSFFLERTD